MASSTSALLGMELMATGENDSTWGPKTNNNLITMEYAVNGYLSKAVTGNTTLSDTQYVPGSQATAEAKNMLIRFTGAITSSATITMPALSALHYVINGTTGGQSLSFIAAASTGTTMTLGATASSFVYCDGTNHLAASPTSSSSAPLAVRVITGNTTYTPTGGMSAILAYVVGAGGGGGGCNAPGRAGAGSGGGGGCGFKRISAASVGPTQSVTIGAGGAAGTNVGGDGGTGATSSLGALLTATGGTGGKGNTASDSAVSGGTGGVGSSGDVNITGQAGGPGIGTSGVLQLSGPGGAAPWPGCGGAVGQVGSGSTAAGNNAAANSGGGGSGAVSTGSSGALGGVGGSGIVVIMEFS